MTDCLSTVNMYASKNTYKDLYSIRIVKVWFDNLQYYIHIDITKSNNFIKYDINLKAIYVLTGDYARTRA